MKAAAAGEASRAPREMSTIDLTGGVPPFPVDYREGADAGYRWYASQSAKPLFPFGHGLSYGSFKYDALKVASGNTLRVSFTVTNTGKRSATDVPQVYAAPLQDGRRAMRRLVGFEKVSLEPGETKTISVEVDPRLIARYDVEGANWHIARGSVVIAVARDAADAGMTAAVNIPSLRVHP